MGRLDHIFKDMVHVCEAQIVQKQIGAIMVKVVKNDDYSKSDERILINELKTRLGDEIQIDLDYVSKIPKTTGGKLRFVVSEVEVGHLPSF